MSYSDKLDNAEALADVIEEVKKKMDAAEENWEDAEEDITEDANEEDATAQEENKEEADNEDKYHDGENPLAILKKFLPDSNSFLAFYLLCFAVANYITRHIY